MLALLLASATLAAQSRAERKWLADYVRADDAAATKLLKRFPGSSNPSIERITKLFAAGPIRETHDPGVHHLSFAQGDETWDYTLYLPDGYSPDERYPVVIDMGHFGMRDGGPEKVAQALMNYVNQTDREIIGVRPRIYDRLGREGRYENNEQRISLSVPAFRGLLRELRTRFAVDADRVFLTGISMAGFWAWRIGAALSGDVAGIVPLAAVTHQVRYGWDNLRSLRVHIVHAKDDPTCLFKFADEAYSKLDSLGVKVTSDFFDTGGHLAPFRRFGDGWNAVRDFRRPRNPAIVHFAWQCPEEFGIVHDLEVTDARKAPFRYPTASGFARLERDEKAWRVTGDGVTAITLWIDADAIPRSKSLRLEVDGKKLRKRIKPSWKVAVKAARRTGDFQRIRVATIRLEQ